MTSWAKSLLHSLSAPGTDSPKTREGKWEEEEEEKEKVGIYTDGN